MSVFEKNNKFFMSDSASVIKVYHEGYEVYHSHKHDFIEIVYILDGKVIHRVNNKEYPTSRGDMLIINYGETHSMEISKNSTYVNILMKPEYISKSLENAENAFALLNLSEFESFRKLLDENKRKVTFKGDDRNKAEAIINDIIKEQERQKPGFELFIRSQLNILLISLFRKMSLDLDSSFDGINEKLLHYINLHSSEKLTLSGIAKLCSYNVSYFSRIFKEYTGMTFTEYLKNVRIQKALSLISETNLNITDIIFESGYTDKTRFYNDFKKIAGATPLEYRKSKK